MSPYSALLVFSQLVLLLYLSATGLLTDTPPLWLLQSAGIGVAIWGIIAMKLGQFNIQPEVKASQLVEKGPYRWIRNPMYLGILLVMIPSVVVHFSYLRCLALLLLIVVLILKVQREEKLLLDHFGAVYMRYLKRTKRFLPFIF